jgi:hypothetical protein
VRCFLARVGAESRECILQPRFVQLQRDAQAALGSAVLARVSRAEIPFGARGNFRYCSDRSIWKFSGDAVLSRSSIYDLGCIQSQAR